MRGELHCGVAEHRLVDDRVAAIHALGLVADHLHGHGARDAGALEVPHRRPSEVVQDASWDASRRTRLLPCLPEALEGPAALRAMEHPRNDAAGLLLLRFRDGALRLERRAELGRHHEHSALEILGCARIQSDDARLEVDLAPLEGEHFAADSARLMNSVVNQTFINARTNRSIGGQAPSKYLKLIEKDLKAGTLSEVLRSHLISEEAEAAMRRDDFEGFLRAREKAIATEITRLMSH
jgi:hypothetical protein